MIDAVASSFAGVGSAFDRLDRTAVTVAGGQADPAEAVVDTLAAKDSLDLNVAVLRSALDMQKRVLDILV